MKFDGDRYIQYFKTEQALGRYVGSPSDVAMRLSLMGLPLIEVGRVLRVLWNLPMPEAMHIATMARPSLEREADGFVSQAHRAERAQCRRALESR